MALTPNMSIDLPLVGLTLGPTWASDLNTAIGETVDKHDHTSGKGVQIPSAGLNINGNVDWDANSITDLGSADLTNLSSTLSSGDRRIFSYANELWYRDAAGNNVQITSAGAVSSAGTGNISGLVSPAGATFSTINSQFGWFYDTGKQAVMQSGDLQVFPFDGATAYSNFWTLKAPTTLASNLTLTLPLALGATTLPLVGTSAGVLSFATGLQLGNGTAAAPTYGFSGDTNTGMYNTGTADTIGWATGGTLRLSLDTTSLTSTLPYLGSNGSAANPAISFSSDPDTGMYRTGSNQVGLSTGGTLRLVVGTTAVQSTLPVYLPDGGTAAPGLAFTSDTNTGLYSSGTDTIGFSAGGAVAGFIDSSGIHSSTGFETAGHGVFRVETFTGTIASGATVDFSPSGGRVLLACLGEYNSSGTFTLPIVIGSSGVSRIVGGGSVNTARIFNNDGSTRNYRVVLITA